MNLQEWRNNKIAVGELPSGLKIKFRQQVDIQSVFGGENVPTPILAMVTGADSEPSNGAASLAQQLPALLRMADELIKNTWIEPKVTEDPTDETVTLEEIGVDDKIAFFVFMTSTLGELGNAKSFRVQARTNGNAAHDGQSVLMPTITDPSN